MNTRRIRNEESFLFASLSTESIYAFDVHFFFTWFYSSYVHFLLAADFLSFLHFNLRRDFFQCVVEYSDNGFSSNWTVRQMKFIRGSICSKDPREKDLDKEETYALDRQFQIKMIWESKRRWNKIKFFLFLLIKNMTSC